MKIFYQTNNNNCGIAVTKTIIYHFYKKKISDEELYENVNIGEYGISIWDLEKLNKKYGINLESYQTNFEEFKNYQTREFFLLIVKKQNGNHYTIGKKNKYGVTLYDPAEGKIELTYQQLEPIFTGIYIKISKNTKNSDLFFKFKKTITNLEIEWSDIKNLFFINIIVFAFSVICDFCIKLIFSEIGKKIDTSNLLKIGWMSIMFYLTFHIGEMLETNLISNYKRKYSKNLCTSLINSLKNKKNNYFKKLGTNQFLLIKEHIENISVFISEYINTWLIGIITLLVLGTIMIYFNYLFLIIIPVTFISQYICWLFYKKIYDRYLDPINEYSNKSKTILINLKNFLQKEINKDKLSNLSSKFLEIYKKEIDYSTELTKKHQIITKSNSLANNLIYIFVLLISTYFILFQEIKYEELILLSIFYRKICNCFHSLINFFTFRYKYAYSKQIYQQLIAIGNIKKPLKICMPKVIKIKNLFYGVPEKIIFTNLNLEILPFTLIYGASGTGKSILYNLISQKIDCDKSSIFLDEIDIRNIKEGLHELFIYQTNNSEVEDVNIENVLEKLPKNIEKKSINICKLMKIDINKPIQTNNLSSGQRQFINILLLLKFEEKILLLDEIASNINIKNKVKIFKELIPYIASRNFVICSEHCKDLIKYFPNTINLEKYV